MECGGLLHGSKFSIMLYTWAVYMSCKKQSLLYGGEACRLKDSEVGVLRRERCIVRAAC